jgi:hypothetical protein
MLTSVASPRRFPMTPQLRQILTQAKQLTYAEQLLLITHMVNHTLPLPDDGVEPITEGRSATIVDEMPSIEPALPAALPVVPRLPIDDPQYTEFRDELAQYKQDLQQG